MEPNAEPSTQAPIFHSLLSGFTVLARACTRLGYHSQGFRVLIPTPLGEDLEQELLRCNPDAWQDLCGGIEVFADGQLKQLVIAETIWVGWKTGPIRNRKRAQAWSPTPADKTPQPHPRS